MDAWAQLALRITLAPTKAESKMLRIILALLCCGKCAIIAIHAVSVPLLRSNKPLGVTIPKRNNLSPIGDRNGLSGARFPPNVSNKPHADEISSTGIKLAKGYQVLFDRGGAM